MLTINTVLAVVTVLVLIIIVSSGIVVDVSSRVCDQNLVHAVQGGGRLRQSCYQARLQRMLLLLIAVVSLFQLCIDNCRCQAGGARGACEVGGVVVDWGLGGGGGHFSPTRLVGGRRWWLER
jgi:hypothetical protein